MSRLDSFIRRLLAQRACLDRAADLVRDLPGPVLELGLGNGRTYDHLRERLPERDIWVFERRPDPHPLCRPPDERLIVGELEATLPGALARIGAPAALVHADIGTGDPERNARLAARLAVLLPPLLRDGAIVVSDQALASPVLTARTLPKGVEIGRYFLYKCSPPR